MSESPGLDAATDCGEDGLDGIDIGSIRAQLAATDLSRHLASFYRNGDEQLSVAAAYVANGIERGERVLYIADDNDTETVLAAFETVGLDVRELRDGGQLVVRDSGTVYGDGGFDPDRAADEIAECARTAVEDGYEGLRAAGENTWAFDLDCEFDRVIEFEVGFDDRCPELPVTALCQYSLDQFEGAAVGKALQTHEQVIYRGRLCENPYFVSPTEAVDGDAPLPNAELLLQ